MSTEDDARKAQEAAKAAERAAEQAKAAQRAAEKAAQEAELRARYTPNDRRRPDTKTSGTGPRRDED
jgi:hypothetical protein